MACVSIKSAIVLLRVTLQLTSLDWHDPDLGEVARAVLLHLIDMLVLFDGFSSQKLNTQYAFDTAYMSAIEADKASPDSADSATRKVLVQTLGLDPSHVSATDITTVRRVCAIVGTRAARLSGCAIGAVLIHTGNVQSDGKGGSDEGVQMGLDGSVIEFYPHFEERLREALKELLGPEGEKRVKIGLAKDGSGIGGESSACFALISLSAII